MITRKLNLTFLMAIAAGLCLQAPADPTNQNPVQPAAEPQESKNPPSGEGSAKLTESQKQGEHLKTRTLTNRFEAFQNLTPEERRAKIQELRERRTATNGPMTGPALEKRLKGVLDELKRKKADGTITPAEEQQLNRAEILLKRLENKQFQVPPLKQSGPRLSSTNSIQNAKTPSKN